MQESEALYRAIVEDNPELICRFTPDGTLTFVNQAYCRFFDEQPEELIGYSFMSVIFPDDWAALETQLARLRPEHPVVETKYRVQMPDGDIHWLEWTVRLVVDEAGQPISLQAVGRDVTERQHFEEALQKALASEIELGELKTRFVSMVSHEFRNPLAVMQTNLDLLRHYGDRLTEEQKQQRLDNLQVFIKRMTNLLENLLTVSRGEAGKVEFHPGRLNLLDLCQDVTDEVRTTAPPSLTFRVTGHGECVAVADSILMRQAITNLVSNAAKYSKPDGTIDVIVDCQPDTFTISVADQGIGIPKKDQARLFEGFHRADNVGAIPGTGLGLLIARLAIERHGGTITFESEEGVGTTFTLTLPRDVPHQSTEAD